MMFDNALIVGLGLIGGSLAFDIKSKKLSKHIYALDRDLDTIKRAKDMGLIEDEFKENVNYDLVIFCNPISSLEKVAHTLEPYIKDALITDVASVKEYPEHILKPIFKERYVGAHPIAGSHKNGFESASQDLFKDRLTIICPTDKSKEEHVKKLMDFWKRIGSYVEIMDSKAHDKIFAITSHLPHFIAYTLTDTLPNEYKTYVGQGFLDTTRIGASQSNLWTDIFLYNKKYLLEGIELFKKHLEYLENMIREENKENLRKTLEDISNKRRGL